MTPSEPIAVWLAVIISCAMVVAIGATYHLTPLVVGGIVSFVGYCFARLIRWANETIRVEKAKQDLANKEGYSLLSQTGLVPTMPPLD